MRSRISTVFVRSKLGKMTCMPPLSRLANGTGKVSTGKLAMLAGAVSRNRLCLNSRVNLFLGSDGDWVAAIRIAS